MKNLKVNLLLFTILIFSSSCMEGTSPLTAFGVGPDERTGNRNEQITENSPATIDEDFFGRVLLDSPLALNGGSTEGLSPNMNLNLFLSEPIFITRNPFLRERCIGLDSSGFPDQSHIDQCFSVAGLKDTEPLPINENKWGYDANSLEFAQVNTFYHKKNLINLYTDSIRNVFTSEQDNSPIPGNVYDARAYWMRGEGGGEEVKTLRTFATADVPENAFFDAASFSLNLGFSRQFPSVKVAHDPSVINHELGHGLTYIQLNMRNHAAGVDGVDDAKSDINYYSYDEAGALNEGVADYYSHMINNRDRVLDYIFGAFGTGERPLVEDSSLHIGGLSSDERERLSYPDYLVYNFSNPTDLFEGIHNAGMIISHFLTAFEKDLMFTCGWTFIESRDFVFKRIIETYTYLGDLSTSGFDDAPTNFGTVNHIPSLDTNGLFPTSLMWYSKVRPINYRQFAQTFARLSYLRVSTNEINSCNGVSYPKDQLEYLLDMYGLLLFNNYNLKGNSSKSGHTDDDTTINFENRVNSVLISKSKLLIDPREENSDFFIFDQRGTISDVIAGLLSNGTIREISSNIDDDLIHNNGNNQISPGEIVGISFNLFNNSNSTMGGVQVLANDWDHVRRNPQTGEKQPCSTFSDNWPTVAEGGSDPGADNGQPGDCSYITKTNGVHLNQAELTRLEIEDTPEDVAKDYIHPICFVQMERNGATFWLDQKELMEELELESNQCLDPDKPSSCFIRVIPGAEAAWFTKIDPQKNWGESIPGENGRPNFNSHNLIYMEASREIPPATTFNCRFRARFTNCKDCWHDENSFNGDDHLDWEFSGEKPFKILNFKFTVLN